MQEGIAEILKQLGIMIECNPSSNYLIGSFERFDEHPILRFNNMNLLTSEGKPVSDGYCLSASINTDDPGVFDTSLENEYAIMASCLEEAKDAEGKNRYQRNSVYQYLNEIRKEGLKQSFLMRKP